MSDDPEIERWKRKKLLEMKRQLLIKKAEQLSKESSDTKDVEQTKSQPIKLLKQVFVGRALEVWNAAEYQYPTIIKKIAVPLAALVESKRLNRLTGEQLYWFFRRLGLRVKLNTKIRIYESGELKTIAEKLRKT